MLNRAKRGKILMRALKDLHPLCVRRKNLFSDMDVDDIVEELGVHIWIALIRYRKKPYKQAVKLAYKVGRNRLTSIVRSKLSVVKKGSNVKFTSFDLPEMGWISSSGIYFNGIQIVDTLELIASAAIRKVGIRKASALVRALLYDWKPRRTSEEQNMIMQVLKRDKNAVHKLVRRFSTEVRRSITIDHDHQSLEKVDGKWQAVGKGA